MIAKGKTRELSLFRVATVDQGKVLFAFVRLSSGEVQRFVHKKRTIIDYEKPFFDLLSFFVSPCRLDGCVQIILQKIGLNMR